MKIYCKKTPQYKIAPLWRQKTWYNLKIQGFWFVTPRHLTNFNRRFEEPQFLPSSWSSTFQLLIPELQSPFNIRNGVQIQQKTWVTRNTAVKTSSLTSFPRKVRRFRIAYLKLTTLTTAVLKLPTVTFLFFGSTWTSHCSVEAAKTADGILPQELNVTQRIIMHLRTEEDAWLPT